MLKRILFATFALIGLLLLWEVSSRFFMEYLFVLPPPSRVCCRLLERPDRFFMHAGVTLSEMAGGFFLALVMAFPLAWMMHRWASVSLLFQPLFILIQCIPVFTLAPIMVMWFGWGYLAITIPTALMIFFPLTMNIYRGLQSTPRAYLDFFHLHQATRWQVFYKLQMPWALPQIFAGFRIAAAIAGIGAIAGEWAGGQAGLGMLMLESRHAVDLETTFGALFVLLILSCIFYGVILLVEKVFYYRRLIPRLVGSVVLLGLCLFGCQPSPKQENVRLLLDWLPNPNHVPLYVGLEKGFFSKNGIPLEILKLHSSIDSIPYLTSRQAEMAIFYSANTIRVNAKEGQKIKPVGVLVSEPANGVIFRSGEGLENFSDLSGKTIGYFEDGTQTGVLRCLLETNYVQPKELRNVMFDLVSTLGSKQVDAIYGVCSNIECEHLRFLGIETDFFNILDLGYPKYLELIVIANEGSPQVDPKFVIAFKEALQDSIDFSLANPEEAFEIYQRANPDKSEQTISWERQAWVRTQPLLARTQEINEKEWSDHVEWLKNHHCL